MKKTPARPEQSPFTLAMVRVKKVLMKKTRAPLEQPPRRQLAQNQRRRPGWSLLLIRFIIVACVGVMGLLAYSAVVTPPVNQFKSAFPHRVGAPLVASIVLRGHVEDHQRGTPLTGAVLSAGKYRAITDRRGSFSLPGVTPGSLVQVDAPGFEPGFLFADAEATLPLIPTATEMTRRYLAAFQQRRYGDLWEALHPDVQAQWTTKQSFIDFYRAEYNAYEVTGFGIGPTHVLAAWRNLALPQVYQQVVVRTVALKVTPHPAARPVPDGLLDSLAFTMVKSHGVWSVLFGGPTGPVAPLLMPQRIAPRLAVLPILMYHHVTRVTPPTFLQYNLTVTTTDFARQMDYLDQHHYHPVTMSDLLALLYYGKALPTRPIILTFDDGYSDAYSDVLPVLLHHSFRATFPIITGFVGQQVGVNGYMTWPQIRELAAKGMEITSHTVTHSDLNIVAPEVAINEITFSRLALQQQLQQPIEMFTYPSGEPFRTGKVSRQQFITRQLEQAGYIGALLDPLQPGQLHNAQTPYELTRIRVLPDGTLSSFAGRLTV